MLWIISCIVIQTAQLFGILPVSEIFATNMRSVKFRWIRLKVLMAILAILGASLETVLSMLRAFKEGFDMHVTGKVRHKNNHLLKNRHFLCSRNNFPWQHPDWDAFAVGHGTKLAAINTIVVSERVDFSAETVFRQTNDTKMAIACFWIYSTIHGSKYKVHHIIKNNCKVIYLIFKSNICSIFSRHCSWRTNILRYATWMSIS